MFDAKCAYCVFVFFLVHRDTVTLFSKRTSWWYFDVFPQRADLDFFVDNAKQSVGERACAVTYYRWCPIGNKNTIVSVVASTAEFFVASKFGVFVRYIRQPPLYTCVFPLGVCMIFAEQMQVLRARRASAHPQVMGC